MGYHARHRADERKYRRTHLLSRLITFVILIVIVGYPFFEPFNIQVDRNTITTSELSSDIGTLSVVYVSDIHMGNYFSQSRVNELISQINALNPDLILLGGDYATDAESAVDFFKNSTKFHARYAVCAVVGDADRAGASSNLNELRAAMISAGVTPLINDVAQVRIGNGSVWIAGLDDATSGTPSLSTISAKVTEDDYVIFLSHTPSVITDALKATSSDGSTAWFDLGLFGHTHGGQAPLLGNLLGLTTDIPERYISGWLSENRTPLLISNGIGTIGLPIRVFHQPQYHVITIKYGT